MKSFLISDNVDTFLALKLAGIEGIYIKNVNEVGKEYKKALARDYGIIFITEKIYQAIKEEVIARKTSSKLPLITIIPDRFGFADNKGKITNYIKESIGF